MKLFQHGLRAARCMVAAAAAGAASGCVFIPPESAEERPPAAVVPATPPPAAVVPEPPSARPAPVQAARPPTQTIALVFDGGNSEHVQVAAVAAVELEAAGHRVAAADIRDERALDALLGRDALVTVAVGFEAAALARRELAAPLVFCQVYNHHDLLEPASPVWGIEAVPPIRLQLQAWKALDPSLERVALIVGEGHRPFAEAAVAAGRELDIAVTYDVAASDRETSYLFKRAAPRVDGIWLPPDGRILSPRVLRELLDYAVDHGVGVGVANDALLPWGALLSATGTPSDVASAVRRVVARITNGRAADVPPLTPLSELELDVNARVAAELGLTAPTELPWVLRAPD